MGSAPPEAAANSTLSTVVVGFLFVMVVLSTLAAITSVTGAIFARQAARDAARSAKTAQQAAEALANSQSQSPAKAVATSAAAAPRSKAEGAPADDQVDPVLYAVIAAAVHSVIGDRAHRIVSMRSAGPGWAQEGRRQIFSSHRVR